MHTLIHVVIKGLIKLILYKEFHYLCVGRTVIFIWIYDGEHWTGLSIVGSILWYRNRNLLNDRV